VIQEVTSKIRDVLKRFVYGVRVIKKFTNVPDES
jgi:hypothetical protein